MTGNLTTDVDALRNVPFFAAVAENKLRLLAFACDHLRFDPGEELFAQGAYGDTAYVILSGSVDILVDVEGREVQVAHLGQHEIVGEMAILCETPRSATARAREPLHTLKIQRTVFFELLETAPNMAAEMLRVLARRLAKTTADLSALKANAA